MSEDIDKNVLRKYDVQQKLGKGAYGIVWKATDKRKDKGGGAGEKVVALKKIFDAFQNSTDAQRTYREIVFLQQFRGHENIVKLEEVLKADNDRDIYLVFEYMETDLHATIRANILEEIHKQYIMYQAFKALKYMHSAGLVHRDMKPANLLLNAECLMKVADFGLARSVDMEGRKVEEEGKGDVLTDYIATRWYRAPEILLGSSRYGIEVDIWSLGCIFAEMICTKPCFSGTSTLNQMEKIMETLGRPTEAEVASMDAQYATSMLDNCVVAGESEARDKEQAAPPAAAAAGDATKGGGEEPSRQQAEGAAEAPAAAAAKPASAPPPPLTPEELRTRWERRFGPMVEESVRSDVVDLLFVMMRFSKHDRITAQAGLEHPYCAQFRDPETETVASSRVAIPISDNTKKTTQQYREECYAPESLFEGLAKLRGGQAK